MSNGRPWTPDDTSALKRHIAAGMTHAQIGDTMKRHPKMIGKKAREFHLAPGVSMVHRAMMARVNARRMAQRARA